MLFRTVLAWTGGMMGFVLSMPIILVGLPFWMVARLTCTLERYFQRSTVEWNELIRYDRAIGWRPYPSLNVYCRAAGADIFYAETDHEGWCGPSSFEACEVVVFGDSYAFGYAANHPFFRQTPKGIKIKAVGAPGYNMVQEVLLLRELAPRLRGKLVPWLIYSGNDLTDNLSPAMWGYRSPFVRETRQDGQWEIVCDHLHPSKWAAQPRYDLGRKVAAVFGDNPHSERVYKACEFLMGEGLRACRMAGARLVVFLIPWALQYEPLPWKGVTDPAIRSDKPERTIGAICKQLGIDFVAGREHFAKRHYIEHEGHLNDAGHRQLADILGKLHEKHRGADVRAHGTLAVLDEVGSL